MYGDMHPTVTDVTYNKALMYMDRGEKDVAKQLFLECEAMYGKVFGADHSKTMDAARAARACG